MFFAFETLPMRRASLKHHLVFDCLLLLTRTSCFIVALCSFGTPAEHFCFNVFLRFLKASPTAFVALTSLLLLARVYTCHHHGQIIRFPCFLLLYAHDQILYGNVAPGGAVAKITGKEGLTFSGVAKVCAPVHVCFFAYLVWLVDEKRGWKIPAG